MFRFNVWKLMLVLAVCWTGVGYAMLNFRTYEVLDKKSSSPNDHEQDAVVDKRNRSRSILAFNVDSVLADWYDSLRDQVRITLRQGLLPVQPREQGRAYRHDQIQLSNSGTSQGVDRLVEEQDGAEAVFDVARDCTNADCDVSAGSNSSQPVGLFSPTPERSLCAVSQGSCPFRIKEVDDPSSLRHPGAMIIALSLDQ